MPAPTDVKPTRVRERCFTSMMVMLAFIDLAELLGPRSGAGRYAAAAAAAEARRAPLPISGGESCAQESKKTLAVYAHTFST